MSLAQIFKPNSLNTRNGAKYKWIQFLDKKSIQNFVSGKHKMGNVDVDIRNHPDTLPKLLDGKDFGWKGNFTYYGVGDPEECKEAWEYDDGRILMCMTTASFDHTEASHSAINTLYIGLTPIEGTR